MDFLKYKTVLVLIAFIPLPIFSAHAAECQALSPLNGVEETLSAAEQMEALSACEVGALDGSFNKSHCPTYKECMGVFSKEVPPQAIQEFSKLGGAIQGRLIEKIADIQYEKSLKDSELSSELRAYAKLLHQEIPSFTSCERSSGKTPSVSQCSSDDLSMAYIKAQNSCDSTKNYTCYKTEEVNFKKNNPALISEKMSEVEGFIQKKSEEKMQDFISANAHYIEELERGVDFKKIKSGNKEEARITLLKKVKDMKAQKKLSPIFKLPKTEEEFVTFFMDNITKNSKNSTRDILSQFESVKMKDYFSEKRCQSGEVSSLYHLCTSREKMLQKNKIPDSITKEEIEKILSGEVMLSDEKKQLDTISTTLTSAQKKSVGVYFYGQICRFVPVKKTKAGQSEEDPDLLKTALDVKIEEFNAQVAARNANRNPLENKSSKSIDYNLAYGSSHDLVNELPKKEMTPAPTEAASSEEAPAAVASVQAPAQAPTSLLPSTVAASSVGTSNVMTNPEDYAAIKNAAYQAQTALAPTPLSVPSSNNGEASLETNKAIEKLTQEVAQLRNENSNLAANKSLDQKSGKVTSAVVADERTNATAAPVFETGSKEIQNRLPASVQESGPNYAPPGIFASSPAALPAISNGSVAVNSGMGQGQLAQSTSGGKMNAIMLISIDDLPADKIQELVKQNLSSSTAKGPLLVQEAGNIVELVPVVKDGRPVLDENGNPKIIKVIKGKKDVYLKKLAEKSAKMATSPDSFSTIPDLRRRDEVALKLLEDRSRYESLMKGTKEALATP